MNKLPLWVLTDKFPSIYDSESATTIEMVSKLYGAMNQLIEQFNEFVETNTAETGDWFTQTTANIEAFAVGLRQEFQDFIDIVELKYKAQKIENQEHINEVNSMVDELIKDFESTILYIRDNIYDTTKQIIRAGLENSDIVIELAYNSDNEELIVEFSGGNIEIQE